MVICRIGNLSNCDCICNGSESGARLRFKTLLLLCIGNGLILALVPIVSAQSSGSAINAAETTPAPKPKPTHPMITLDQLGLGLSFPAPNPSPRPKPKSNTTTLPKIKVVRFPFLEDPNWNFGHKKLEYGEDTLEMTLRAKIAEVTIPMALIGIFVSFTGFFICLTCPMRLLRKWRARQLRKGYQRKPLIIRVAPNPPTLQQSQPVTKTSLATSTNAKTNEMVVEMEQAKGSERADGYGSNQEMEVVYETKDGEQFEEVELEDMSYKTASTISLAVGEGAGEGDAEGEGEEPAQSKGTATGG